jgi:hypothetical protein
MERIDLAQDRHKWRALVNTVVNVLVPYRVGKFLNSCTIGSFSRRAQFHEDQNPFSIGHHSTLQKPTTGKVRLLPYGSCERCQEETETATHILCECEALAYLRLRHFSQYFMEQSDYFDAPTYKILRFE